MANRKVLRKVLLGVIVLIAIAGFVKSQTSHDPSLGDRISGQIQTLTK